MLERAEAVTRSGGYTYVEYVRVADDLVILVDAYRRHDWLRWVMRAGASPSSEIGWRRRSGGT